MPFETTTSHPWRIGICGSASVGKTTLANALADELGLPCLREEMRDHLEATGENLAALPPEAVEKTLLHLWKEREQREASTPFFVADNAAIDFAAYALYYGCLSEESFEALYASSIAGLQRYDAVILLPWGVLPYQQDTVRPRNPYLQLRYQVLLEGLLRKHLPSQKLHVLPESLLSRSERLGWATARLQAMGAPTSPMSKGTVYLVGAGPGDPKLLTQRGAELLQQADVVAYDLLISPELLALAPESAELVPVGRRYGTGATGYRLHPEVMRHAQAGKTVVRLKSGDPLIFGRGGEEAEELKQAGIPFEIVPGITAALGAAAYAGIPLTHRGYAAEVLITTGHDAQNGLIGEVSGRRDSTIAVYMGSRRLKVNLDQLCAQGLDPETPAALVVSASTPRQQVFIATLATLHLHVPQLPPEVPAILIVGATVALREQVRWFMESFSPGNP